MKNLCQHSRQLVLGCPGFKPETFHIRSIVQTTGSEIRREYVRICKEIKYYADTQDTEENKKKLTAIFNDTFQIRKLYSVNVVKDETIGKGYGRKRS
jgi:disulfide oxidoreductase YuzD